ncbi:MAG: aryl-sulfate sulfotransferase, partial [Bacteroidota bacterium]
MGDLKFDLNKIYEIEKIGTDNFTVVWEWDFFDHLIQDFDSTKNNFGIVAEHPELLDVNWNLSNTSSDWIHTNAITYNEALDQIMISSREMNEIYVIDHSTTSDEAAGHSGGRYGKGGDILYRYGNPQVYRRGGPSEKVLFGQHDPKWIPDGYPQGGKISIFNNGSGRFENYSSIDVFQAPMNMDGSYDIEEGEAFGPSFPSWTYTAPIRTEFFSNNVSGVQALPNGNFLICSGRQGDFFEVTPEKERVWYYENTAGNDGPLTQGLNPPFITIFRTERYAPDYPGFEGKDLSPMGVIELNPIAYECEIYNDVSSISTQVFSDYKVFPNPFESTLNIEVTLSETVDLRVINLQGKEI